MNLFTVPLETPCVWAMQGFWSLTVTDISLSGTNL